MNIEDITAPDVLAIGKAIEARGTSDMARRAMRQTGQIFKQAIREGLTNLSPVIDLTEALKPHKVKHHSRITSQQLPKLLQDINAYEDDLLVKLGLWFMCYTFVRTQELRFMEWSEIDYQYRYIMMTKTFNPIDYLETEAEIADYLHEAYLDDDPQIFVIALGHLVKHHGVSKVAEMTGLNRESLYKSINGDSKPTWDTMHRLLKALKLDVNFLSIAE